MALSDNKWYCARPYYLLQEYSKCVCHCEPELVENLVALALEIDGRVGSVHRGEIEGTVLRIAPNDAAVFEVTGDK